MSDLHYLSATEAVRLFRARKLSPVELVQAVIDRASRVEPAINAFAETRYEEALAQARAAEARYAVEAHLSSKAFTRPLDSFEFGPYSHAGETRWQGGVMP